MTVTRRTVLQAAAGGFALAPLARVAADVSGPLPPVDFTGAGLYLYPDWGQPCAYRVVATGPGNGVLEFRDPATDALYWTQSLTLTGRFAAKLA